MNEGFLFFCIPDLYPKLYPFTKPRFSHYLKFFSRFFFQFAFLGGAPLPRNNPLFSREISRRGGYPPTLYIPLYESIYIKRAIWKIMKQNAAIRSLTQLPMMNCFLVYHQPEYIPIFKFSCTGNTPSPNLNLEGNS